MWKSKNIDLGLLVLRVSIGLLMLLHGIAKIGPNFDIVIKMVLDNGLPYIISYAVYAGEIIAPLMLVAGFRTRIAAIVFAINCVTAIALAHSANLFSLTPYGGWKEELLGLYLLGAICLFFTGGGRFSVSSTNLWD